MNNRPYGNELLAVARRVLLDELLPLLPAERVYDALMVANAMAIAARELASHADGDQDAAVAIGGFFQLAGIQDAEATEAGLAELIRLRKVAPKHGPALRALLVSLTESKLALSNPKYVKS